MSGEKIGEGNGQRGMRKVLSTLPTFKVEVSFEEHAKLLGVEGMNMGTYTAITKPDGSLEGAWPSAVPPTDRAVTGEIDRLLNAKPSG